jgi:hypothetical protein
MFTALINKARTMAGNEDAARLAKRAEVKNEMPAATERQQRLVSIARELEICRQQTDASTETHGAKCEPLQRALAAAPAEEQAVIRAQIDAANRDLEGELQQIRTRAKQLAREQREILAVPALTPQVLQNKLADLASPKLLLVLFVTKQASEWAQRRLAHATAEQKKWLSLWQNERARRENTEYTGMDGIPRKRDRPPGEAERDYRDLADRWAAEVAAAETALAEARRAADEARKACIAE